jgi:hypothetical protein
MVYASVPLALLARVRLYAALSTRSLGVCVDSVI